VVMWDVESGKKIASWSVGNSRMRFLSIPKKQDLIVAASEDGTFWFNSAKSHGNGRSVQYNPLGCGSVPPMGASWRWASGMAAIRMIDQEDLFNLSG